MIVVGTPASALDRDRERVLVNAWCEFAAATREASMDWSWIAPQSMEKS
jgi:hypothetical protein